MAVVAVTEGWSERKASAALDAGVVVDRHFEVITSAATDDGLVVLQDASIPKLGKEFPGSPFLRCRSVTPTPVGPMFWRVVASYFSPADDISNNPTLSPFLEPPRHAWGASSSVEPIDEDADGNPIINSCNEPFDPSLTIEVNDLVLTIERNQQNFDSSDLVDYFDAVNSGSFMGHPAGTARIVNITATEERIKTEGPLGESQDYIYWKVTYEIHFRAGIAADTWTDPFDATVIPTGGPSRAWYHRVLNQGTRERIGALQMFDEDDQPTGFTRPDFRAITDSNGDRITTPVPLTASGRVLPAGYAPLYLEFRKYPSVDFAPLDLT